MHPSAAIACNGRSATGATSDTQAPSSDDDIQLVDFSSEPTISTLTARSIGRRQLDARFARYYYEFGAGHRSPVLRRTRRSRAFGAATRPREAGGAGSRTWTTWSRDDANQGDLLGVVARVILRGGPARRHLSQRGTRVPAGARRGRVEILDDRSLIQWQRDSFDVGHVQTAVVELITSEDLRPTMRERIERSGGRATPGSCPIGRVPVPI